MQMQFLNTGLVVLPAPHFNTNRHISNQCKDHVPAFNP